MSKDNYLQDYHKAMGLGASGNPMADERARIEKELEKDRLKAAQKAASSSSPKTEKKDKVICTELVRQGLFDRADYLLGARYVEEHLTERHVRGYHAWGLPVVRKMRRSPRATAFWRKLAQARADHIAFLYGDASRRNRLGAVLCAIGHPACYLIGGMVGEQEGIEDAKPGGDQENRAPSEKLSEVASRCGP
ncbi:hypothetical protein [Pannonibacter indicus]|uniref:hypothetical protein n=1 Tax=Pannonibacter indicus TaxID=466044 RepID=UPI0035B09028